MFGQTMCCKYCDSADVVRYGSQSGHPRCRCNQCRRTFQVSYTYRAYEPGVKNQIVDLTMKGRGVGDTARVLGIGKNTVLAALKKSMEVGRVYPLSSTG